MLLLNSELRIYFEIWCGVFNPLKNPGTPLTLHLCTLKMYIKYLQCLLGNIEATTDLKALNSITLKMKDLKILDSIIVCLKDRTILECKTICMKAQETQVWATHLDVPVGKQILRQGPVHSGHAGVVDGKAVRQQVLQLQILQDEA